MAKLYASASQLALAAACFGWMAANAEEAPSESGADAGGDRIVVTGSRIVRRDFVSNSPIVTADDQVLDTSATVSLEANLLQLPQFVGFQSNSPSLAGQALLNMRNLGDSRNLVLLDGRRLMPSNENFTVDVNTVAPGLIDSVEVISGGASAVYGSDALSGVVNFKLRRDFEGLELSSRVSYPENDGGREVNVNVLMGGNFDDDRGNAFLSVDYTDTEGLLYREREFFHRSFAAGDGPYNWDFFDQGYYIPGLGGLPSQDAVDTYFAANGGAPAGAVANTTSIGFNDDGASLFNTRGATIYNYQAEVYPENPYNIIYNGAVKYNSRYDSTVVRPLERHSLFGGTEYKVNDWFSAFVQGYYTRYESGPSAGLASATYPPLTIPHGTGFNLDTAGLGEVTAGNPNGYLTYSESYPVPDAFETLLASRNGGTGSSAENTPWVLFNYLGYMGNRTSSVENDVFQLTLGGRGELPIRDWTWEIYGSTGEMNSDAVGVGGFVSSTAYEELLFAPLYGKGHRDGTGEVVCTSGVQPFGAANPDPAYGVDYPQVNPNQTVNIGGEEYSTTVSADCMDYMERTFTNRVSMEQDIVEANLQGHLMTLPAGDARFAAGATYRRNTYEKIPDPLYDITRVAGLGDLESEFGILASAGSSEVWEVYGEALVPVARDLPFMRALDVSIAYRYSDYALSGGVSTYKADGNWTIVDGLQFRGGYQRAVRAPNIVELFSPIFTVASVPGYDPCRSNIPYVPYSNTPTNPDQAQVRDLCTALMIRNGFTPPPGYFDTFVGGNTDAVGAHISGNTDLEPEAADTITAGFVFSPTFDLPAGADFQAAVDYYSIDIDNAIGYVSGEQSYELCFNANGMSNPTYDPDFPSCQGIVLSPANGNPLYVRNTYANQAGIKTSGVDIQAELTIPVGRGSLEIDSVASYLDSFERSYAVGAPFVEYADHTNGYFGYKLFNTLAYNDPLGVVGVKWRYLPSVHDIACISFPGGECPAGGTPDTSSSSLFDIFARWDARPGVTLMGGVDNVTDEAPPEVAGLSGTTDPTNYDVVGRRFYVALRAKF